MLQNLGIHFLNLSVLRNRNSYGSGSNIWQVMVLVPASAPYLDHKKQFSKKYFVTNLVFSVLIEAALLLEVKEIRYTISYCVCENFCDSILLQFRFRRDKKLRFLRFRFRFQFRNTESYDVYSMTT